MRSSSARIVNQISPAPVNDMEPAISPFTIGFEEDRESART